MQPSNPLIAVGISAIIVIGSATIAAAQEHPANARSTDFKDDQRSESGSLQLEQKDPEQTPQSAPQSESLASEHVELNDELNRKETVAEVVQVAQDANDADDTEPSSSSNLNRSEEAKEDVDPETEAIEEESVEAESSETVEAHEVDRDADNSELEPSQESEPAAPEAEGGETENRDTQTAQDTPLEPDSESQLLDSDDEDTGEEALEDIPTETELTDPSETDPLEEDLPDVEDVEEDLEEDLEPEELEPEAIDEEDPIDQEEQEEIELQDLDEEDEEIDEEEDEEEVEIDPGIDETTTTEPTLEYLDPDANPLFFPTEPEEVEIVGTQPITLEEALAIGIRNNTEIQQARLELQRAQAELQEVQAENFPDVSANANLTYQASEQPETQTSIDPATGTFQSEIEGTEFQDTTALGGSLELNYSVFTSGRRPALIQAAERQVRFQELQVEDATEDLALQITQTYYDLQEADEQTQIFQAAVDEAERSLRDAQALEEAGVGTRFDVLQAEVDLANAQQDLRNQQSQQEIARRELAELLNISQSINLSAAEPIEVAGVWEPSLEETIVLAFRNRADLEQQLVQREIAERNRRAALAQLGPQVNLSASYGLNNDLSEDEVGFLSDFQVGLGVSLLLFDGGEVRAQARQAEANIAIAETQFADLRDQIRFEVEQAYSQLQANFENIQTTALAVQQAEEALRLARLRFQAGVGTQIEVLNSQTDLTQARFNNLQAILNYNRALAQLQRAVSNLPEGFLNDAP